MGRRMIGHQGNDCVRTGTTCNTIGERSISKERNKKLDKHHTIYADEKAALFANQPDKHHRYHILESADNANWNLLVDKSQNNTEVPHDYVELPHPVKTRYLKIVNVEMPTGCFAISDFRLFGRGPGQV